MTLAECWRVSSSLVFNGPPCVVTAIASFCRGSAVVDRTPEARPSPEELAMATRVHRYPYPTPSTTHRISMNLAQPVSPMLCITRPHALDHLFAQVQRRQLRMRQVNLHTGNGGTAHGRFAHSRGASVYDQRRAFEWMRRHRSRCASRLGVVGMMRVWFRRHFVGRTAIIDGIDGREHRQQPVAGPANVIDDGSGNPHGCGGRSIVRPVFHRAG